MGTYEEKIADLEKRIHKLEEVVFGSKTTPQAHARKSAHVPAENLSSDLILNDLKLPQFILDSFVEMKDKLSNWQTLFILLVHAPDGLTNKQLRSLAEELGKPITYSWFDTEFHRRVNEGLVISRRVPGVKEKMYFLAAPEREKQKID